MSDLNQTLVILTLYRIITIVVGLAFAYLGYNLFCRGIFDKAGDLNAAWGNFKLVIKRGTPGTFFALFGTVLIVFSLWKGVNVEEIKKKLPSQLPLNVEITSGWPKEDQERFWEAMDKVGTGRTLEHNDRELISRYLSEHTTISRYLAAQGAEIYVFKGHAK